MSIVVIELDQSAAGKTYRARRSPTPYVQTGLRFVPLKRPPRPCTAVWEMAGSYHSWRRLLGDDSRGIISQPFASASLRPYSRDIRFPPFARTRASDSFR